MQLCRDPLQGVCVVRRSEASPNVGVISAWRVPRNLMYIVADYLVARRCEDLDLLVSGQ